MSPDAEGRDDTWVVVPAYNEAATISTVISALRAEFRSVICVDDGSDDNTAQLASAAGALVIGHPVNLGQGAALQTGFDYVLRFTRARYCVTFDGDGQHLVSDAVRMTERARATGVDVMLASRFLGSTTDMPRLRRLTLRGALLFSKMYDGLQVTDTHNGLRVLSRHALESIRLTLPRMAYASELQYAIGRAGLSYLEEPVSVIYTEYSMRKGQHNINAVNILFDLAARRMRAAQ
jgi:glycosyltransferase involved in cell wall biosynthesis